MMEKDEVDELPSFKEAALEQYKLKWSSLFWSRMQKKDFDDPPPPPPYPSALLIDKASAATRRRKMRLLVILTVSPLLILSWVVYVAIYRSNGHQQRLSGLPITPAIPSKPDPLPATASSPSINSTNPPSKGSGGGGYGSGPGPGISTPSLPSALSTPSTPSASRLDSIIPSTAPSNLDQAQAPPVSCKDIVLGWEELMVLPGFELDQTVSFTKCQRVEHYRVPDSIDVRSIKLFPPSIEFHQEHSSSPEGKPMIAAIARIKVLSYKSHDKTVSFGGQFKHQWTLTDRYGLKKSQVKLFAECALLKLRKEFPFLPSAESRVDCSLFVEFLKEAGTTDQSLYETIATLEFIKTHEGPVLWQEEVVRNPKLLERMKSPVTIAPKGIPLRRTIVWQLDDFVFKRKQTLPYNFPKITDMGHSLEFIMQGDGPVLNTIIAQGLGGEQHENFITPSSRGKTLKDVERLCKTDRGVTRVDLPAKLLINKLYFRGNSIAFVELSNGTLIPRTLSDEEAIILKPVQVGRAYAALIFDGIELIMLTCEV